MEFLDENFYIIALENFLFVETPGEAETSLSSSTEIMHYPTLLENGSGQDIVSSDLIPPNFGEFEMIYIASSTVSSRFLNATPW